MAIHIGEITNDVHVAGGPAAHREPIAGHGEPAALPASQPSWLERDRCRSIVDAFARDAARTAVEDRQCGEVPGA